MERDEQQEEKQGGKGGKEEEHAVDRAQQVVKRLEAALKLLGLTPFSAKIVIQFISSKLERGEGEKLNRVIGYLLSLINRSSDRESDPFFSSRRGCPQLIPGLRARPFWETEDFPWVEELQSKVEAIRSEFLALRNAQHVQAPRDVSVNEDSTEAMTTAPSPSHTHTTGFQHYRSPSAEVEVVESGKWNVCYLALHGMDFSQNASLCPATMQTIKTVPGEYNHAFFSALAPQSHIAPHHGPTNKKLRVYFPLFVPPADSPRCWLKVDAEKRVLEQGRCIIFDDSFLHEAANEDDSNPRVNLIFDVWHPDLTAEEIKILDFINKGQQNAAKRLKSQVSLSGETTNEESDDFFSLIKRSSEEGIQSADICSIWAPYMNRALI